MYPKEKSPHSTHVGDVPLMRSAPHRTEPTNTNSVLDMCCSCAAHMRAVMEGSRLTVVSEVT